MMSGLRARPAIFALAVLGVLGVAFFQTQGDDVDQVAQVVLAISDADDQNGLVLRHIVRLREYQDYSYDDLVRASVDFRDAVTKIRASLTQRRYQDLTANPLATLVDLAQARDDDIERLKSVTAVMRNSLSQVPRIIDELDDLIDANGDARQAATLRSLHDRFLNHLLTPTAGNSEQMLKDLDVLNAAFTAAAPQLPPQSLQVLTTHLPVLMRYKAMQDQLLTQILGTPVHPTLRRLHEIVLAENAAARQRMSLVRWVLMLLCVVLVPYAAFAYARQRRLNVELEDKVKARTAELTGANAVLQQEMAERKAAETAAAEAQQQLVLSSKMAALGEMAGGIAHEINNPVAIIDFRAGHVIRLLSQEPPVVDKCIEFAQVIKDTAQRIAKIVAGLKTFSRVDTNDPFSAADAGQIIDDSLAFCRERLKNHGIELRTASMPAQVIIDCHPVQISQVIVNLMNNAHDAIRCAPEPRWIDVSLIRSGDLVEIAVTDSGSGIPESVREKIFQPFFTTKDVGSGTGLGLSVSRSIARVHGGDLIYDATSSHTRFILRLPAGRTASGAAA